MRLRFVYLLLLTFVAAACSKQDGDDVNPGGSGGSEWLIPVEDIANLGDPMDVIPSIDQPAFDQVGKVELPADERVLVYKREDVVKVYPVTLLSNREIVNDMTNEIYHAVTYCPVTGSGINWKREINQSVTEFGVSGMLYHNNLMPYDRNTGSYWSQMLLRCVHGKLKGREAETNFLMETVWETARQYFPEALVLVGDDQRAEAIDFESPAHKTSASASDTADLKPGSLLLGLYSERKVKLYDYNDFDSGITVFRDHFNYQNLIVAGSESLRFIVAFKTDGPAAGKEFTAVQDRFPLIIKDQSGNYYDVFGYVAEGPSKGKRLNYPVFYVAKLFAWKDFFDEIEIGAQ